MYWQYINQAEQALQCNETPVGCVFVSDKQILATGFNATNKSLNVSPFPAILFSGEEGGEFWNTKNPTDLTLSYLLSETGHSTRWNDSHQQNLGKSSPIRILRNRSLRHGRTVHHVCVCTTSTRYPESFLWMFEWAFRRHGGGAVCSFRVSWTNPHLMGRITHVLERPHTSLVVI